MYGSTSNVFRTVLKPTKVTITTVRNSSTLSIARPVTKSTSPYSTAGITTSASKQASIGKRTVVNEEGRLCSRSRLQHVYDPSAPTSTSQEINWAREIQRRRDANALAQGL